MAHSLKALSVPKTALADRSLLGHPCRVSILSRGRSILLAALAVVVMAGCTHGGPHPVRSSPVTLRSATDYASVLDSVLHPDSRCDGNPRCAAPNVVP